jgi:hypothetical protein
VAFTGSLTHLVSFSWQNQDITAMIAKFRHMTIRTPCPADVLTTTPVLLVTGASSPTIRARAVGPGIQKEAA